MMHSTMYVIQNVTNGPESDEIVIQSVELVASKSAQYASLALGNFYKWWQNIVIEKRATFKTRNRTA